MANYNSKDMTEGSLVKLLINFSIPLILSGLLQQLYSWADAFILGNYAGEASLAAAGVCTAVTTLFVMGITGFSSGISILSARYIGMGDKDIQKRILSSFVLVTGGFLLILALLGVIFTRGIILALGTPQDIFDLASDYMRIILVGIPFLGVYNVYAALLRGVGNSRAPFYAVLVSSVANVILDIIFVAVFRWGVKGAAFATVISQVLMCLYIIGYAVGRYAILRFPLKAMKLDRKVLREGMALSLPITIQSMVSSVGSLILQNFMNSFGTTTVAAITAAYRIDCIILIPIINLGTGIATVTSQNLGAGKLDRVRKCLKVGLLLTVAVSACLTLFVILTAPSLIRMFGVSEEAVAIGTNFFRILALFYVVFGTIMSCRGYIEGSGKVVFSGTVAIIGLIIRICLSYILRPYYGNMVIAYAEAIAWVFQALVFLIYACFFINRKEPEEAVADS